MGAWIETFKEESYKIGGAVAPYVGAWIETKKMCLIIVLPTVAPYVGAWIETCYRGWYNKLLESHPTWVRGLKPIIILVISTNVGVAPYVGAWIETVML